MRRPPESDTVDAVLDSDDFSHNEDGDERARKFVLFHVVTGLAMASTLVRRARQAVQKLFPAVQAIYDTSMYWHRLSNCTAYVSSKRWSRHGVD